MKTIAALAALVATFETISETANMEALRSVLRAAQTLVDALPENAGEEAEGLANTVGEWVGHFG